MLILCFFFKQKAAYEMRISDWSSDVCSSDLTGNIAEDCKAVVVVEMSAEALLITQTRDADDHRVGILPVREEAERRRLAANLVLGIVDISEELDLGHRDEAVVRHADRVPEVGKERCRGRGGGFGAGQG